MYKLWVLALLVSVLLCELLACWLSQTGTPLTEFEVPYRWFHLLQMGVLITLAIYTYRVDWLQPVWGRVARLVLGGLTFSLLGDLINSFLIDLSFILQPQTLLSAIPFAIAHFLYIAAFWLAAQSSASTIGGRQLVLTVSLWLPLATGLWLMLVDSSAGPVLKWLSFAYAHVVVLMALTSFWPWFAIGRGAWVAPAGGLVFLLSDAFFGAWLTEGQGRPLWVSQLIWTTYLLAQLCLFHLPLVGRSEQQQQA